MSKQPISEQSLPEQPIDLTIAIPTYNGGQRLPELLQRLQAQVGTEAIVWEILIVDNNSNDDTALVAQSFEANFAGRLRYCFEPQQGVSYARQRAVQEAEGELVAFLDDDNLPDPNWVAAVHQFALTHPLVGAYGGQISGQFEVEPPPRFKHIQAFFAIVERGSQAKRYDPKQRVFPPGAGLVVRRRVWLEHVPTQILLNRLSIKRSDGNNCSEDVEVLLYIQQAGWEIWYNPAMQMAHKIPARRLERDYLLPMFRSNGLSRTAIRSIGMKAWQKPLILTAYWLNDLQRLIVHYYRYRSVLQTDLVAACQMELLIGIVLSPFQCRCQPVERQPWQNPSVAKPT